MSAVAPSGPSGPSVTCMACLQVLPSGAPRAAHYRSDLHRVNLQRKVAGVPPLPPAEYELRAAAARDATAAGVAARAPRFCAVCSKRFASERALANHVASRRHRDAVRVRAPHMGLEEAAVGPVTEGPVGEKGVVLSPADSEEEGIEEEMEMERRIAEAVPFTATECVFDGRAFGSVEENLSHMRSFGFFLPFAESIKDVAPLLEYFGQKVGIGYACVECDRAFTSIPAVQSHMVDSQHCRMTSDGEVWVEEYGQFYAAGDEEGDDEGEDDGWEEVGEEEAAAVDAEMKESGAETVTSQVVATVDGEAGATAAAVESYDEPEEAVAMVLGNKIIGHRSLQRYYKQKVQPSDKRDAVVINKLASEYKVMGWQGRQHPDAELKTKRMQAFKHSKRQLEVGMKNYYTRKAPLKVSFTVLNSGYRP